MKILNLLNSQAMIDFFGKTYDISLDWIGNLIKLLINGVGIVGVGIILFSLILKAIVLPFDIYQRINMRKQNIKMKENQKKMEKWQKQYANDKEAYNRKLMEMYKENGISVMSSCLPMSLSMVIFITAIGGFNAYSQYSNVENYNIMVNAYNEKVAQVMTDWEENYSIPVTKNKQQYTIEIADIMNSSNEELKAVVNGATEGEGVNLEQAQQNAVSLYVTELAQQAVLEAYNTKVIENTSFLWIKNIWVTDAAWNHPVLDYTDFYTQIGKEKFVVDGNLKALEKLDEDVYKKGAVETHENNPYDEYGYNKITGKLGEQKSQANGYFILILLSIGTILLQQFISMRAQKEQQKYSTVDGQGAQQQKTMLVVMTGMFAIFSFMYSSAFSIYMIMSNVLSLISMLVINKLVDYIADKREAKAIQEQYNKRFPGRVALGAKDDKDEKTKK